MKNFDIKHSGGKVKIELINPDDKSVVFSDTKAWAAGKDSALIFNFNREVRNPLKWSAEKPNLYDLVMQVADAHGKVQQVVSQHVGFRRIEIKK